MPFSASHSAELTICGFGLVRVVGATIFRFESREFRERLVVFPHAVGVAGIEKVVASAITLPMPRTVELRELLRKVIF